MRSFYEGKTILVTGGVGSIGSAIVRKLLEYNPKTIRVLDNNETALFTMGEAMDPDKIRLLYGDIRDKGRIIRAVEDVEIIFHAAALKHVPLCELNAFEAVQTNVLGTTNLLEAAMDEEVDHLITISTDKAVNPINVMGASKLLAERLTVSANYYKGSRKTLFSCVRFGNVLNSQGSVIPVFREQIRHGGPVKVTDPGMTRFIMNIEEATELVLKAAYKSKGGEIFILKMPVLSVEDLAKAMIEKYAPLHGIDPEQIEIKYVGKRDGEKIYEELMNENEAEMVVETEDMFILPTFENNHKRHNGTKEKIYKSIDEQLMPIEDIIAMIEKLGIE
jgi:FlaA1/EpsC-like NDP-sugar epimerase